MPKTPSTELADYLERYGNFITYPQAAEITAVSTRTLKRLTATGELPCYRVGRTSVMRLKTADVVSLIERVA